MINTNNNRGNLGYRGKVTIKTKRGGKFYAVHTSHNSGLPKLFTGLCNILSGKANLEQVRPARVAVYSFKSSPLPSINTSWEGLKDQLIAASPLMPLTTEVSHDSNAKSIFQSQIPFGYITSDLVYIVALFPINTDTQNNDYLNDALAFYRIASSTEWQGVKIDRSSIDSSFVIEWQMDFQNISEEA